MLSIYCLHTLKCLCAFQRNIVENFNDGSFHRFENSIYDSQVCLELNFQHVAIIVRYFTIRELAKKISIEDFSEERIVAMPEFPFVRSSLNYLNLKSCLTDIRFHLLIGDLCISQDLGLPASECDIFLLRRNGKLNWVKTLAFRWVSGVSQALCHALGFRRSIRLVGVAEFFPISEINVNMSCVLCDCFFRPGQGASSSLYAVFENFYCFQHSLSYGCDIGNLKCSSECVNDGWDHLHHLQYDVKRSFFLCFYIDVDVGHRIVQSCIFVNCVSKTQKRCGIVSDWNRMIFHRRARVIYFEC